jgi:hypothetical protein
MSTNIKISDEIFERLQKLAVPLVDTFESVLERLINSYESHQNEIISPLPPSSIPDKAEHKGLDGLLRRYPRQKGVTIKICDEVFEARSVPDLYGKVLDYLCQKAYIEKLKPHLPLATSRQRYLVSQNPVHPNGNKFFNLVEYKGYFMEAHKDYDTGIKDLCKVLDYCGLTLSYIG